MNRMTDTQAAYVAGLLDGEGCFSIFKRGTGSVNLSLSCYMTSKEALDALKEFTGSTGAILAISGRENRQDQWLWKPKLSEAYEIVEQILPYLITKKRNAELFLQVLDLRKHSSRWNNTSEQQVKLMEENALLNKRGRN